MSRLTALYVFAWVKQPGTSLEPPLFLGFCQPPLDPTFPNQMYLQRILPKRKCHFFSRGGSSSDPSEVGHLACERREETSAKEGRSPGMSEFVWRVRNRLGRAASQQLFPVFISLFQPLALWWDVRVCVCVFGGVRRCFGHYSSGIWPGNHNLSSSIQGNSCEIDC